VRRNAYLREQYRAIVSHTGFVLTLCGAWMLTPLVTRLVWPGTYSQPSAFVLPAACLAGLGLIAWKLPRPSGDLVVTVQEGGVIVLLSWTVVCLGSAWPFMAACGLTFTQAVFESVSGWTTTGLSVLDVTAAPRDILLWRSTMQLAGGAGLAIIMLSAITGPTGPALSTAEGRDLLVPHVRQSAKLVLKIYAAYAIAGTIGLRLAGMDWFDAVNHAFAAVSTGGFSTRLPSIGYWDNPAIEAVTILLMLFGNLSFVTAWMLLSGRLGAVLRNGEVRLMAFLIPLSAALLVLLTCRGVCPTLGKSIRVAIFEAVSALTTTGFSTVGYTDWNSFGWLVLIVLMLIGGGTCSTAGGIKQYRVYLLYKSLIGELRRWLLPRTAVVEQAVWEADRTVFLSDARLRQIGAFVFLYMATFVIGSAVLAAHGCGLKESLFEYASSLGTVGLSIGVTSPGAPPAVLWAEIAGMFFGRLEFLVVFASAAKLARDAMTLAPRRACP